MKSKKLAKKWYPKIEDKEKVSEEFLRNALCFYEQPPERTVNFLNELPAESCQRLDVAMAKMRERAQQHILENKLSKKKEDEIFTLFVNGKL